MGSKVFYCRIGDPLSGRTCQRHPTRCKSIGSGMAGQRVVRGLGDNEEPSTRKGKAKGRPVDFRGHRGNSIIYKRAAQMTKEELIQIRKKWRDTYTNLAPETQERYKKQRREQAVLKRAARTEEEKENGRRPRQDGPTCRQRKNRGDWPRTGSTVVRTRRRLSPPSRKPRRVMRGRGGKGGKNKRTGTARHRQKQSQVRQSITGNQGEAASIFSRAP